MSQCYLVIQIEGEQTERVVFKLFDDVVPLTTDNFREVVSGEEVARKVERLGSDSGKSSKTVTIVASGVE
ncbi:hypothetical protein DFH09DRAFT_1475646 [Mycena vulgaris]|nr:hypothetical protein DFH09DRAFT_1475646 [Mycena vulgaris]